MTWEVAKSSGCCRLCQRALAAGETHYSALFDDGRRFRRVDVCRACWAGPHHLAQRLAQATDPPADALAVEALPPRDDGDTTPPDTPAPSVGGQLRFVGAWRTTAAARPARRRTAFDEAAVRHLFDRCRDSDDPDRQQFAFVLALMLMRRRRLHFETTQTDPEGRDWWVFGDRDAAAVPTEAMAKPRAAAKPARAVTGADAPSPRPTIRLLNPRLSEEQMTAVSEQLSQILWAEA